MNKIFKIHNKKNQNILFQGKFENFKLCLEQAIEENINLTGADLSHQNLANVTLDGAALTNIDFSHTNLSGANMSETHIKNCTFNHTDLYNVCMAYAHIENCNFAHSNFGATDIAGAHITDCIFENLSCFTLDFIKAHHMKDNVFLTTKFSCPPVIIKGISNTPIIYIGNSIFHGHEKINKNVPGKTFETKIKNKPPRKSIL